MSESEAAEELAEARFRAWTARMASELRTRPRRSGPRLSLGPHEIGEWRMEEGFGEGEEKREERRGAEEERVRGENIAFLWPWGFFLEKERGKWRLQLEPGDGRKGKEVSSKKNNCVT